LNWEICIHFFNVPMFVVGAKNVSNRFRVAIKLRPALCRPVAHSTLDASVWMAMGVILLASEDRRLVRCPWREEDVEEGAQDDSAFEGEVPVFQILDVAGDAVLDVGAVAGFAAEAADLSEAGNAGFDEGADVIVGHELGRKRKLGARLESVGEIPSGQEAMIFPTDLL
jgi:hypothetical protein